MTWGVWIERLPYDPGHPRPEMRCWLQERTPDDRSTQDLVLECERDAIQHAAVWRVPNCKKSDFADVPNYGVVQARRYSPTMTCEHQACEPDVSSLTGWFAS